MKSRHGQGGRESRYFSFLRRLRAGGRSNMYGAIPYLAAAFGLDRNEAFRIVCEWVDSQEEAVPSPRPRSDAAGREVAPREPTLFDQPPAALPSAMTKAARAPGNVAATRVTRAARSTRAERRPVKSSARSARRPSGPKAA